jgi:hypothetical protein
LSECKENRERAMSAPFFSVPPYPLFYKTPEHAYLHTNGSSKINKIGAKKKKKKNSEQ